MEQTRHFETLRPHRARGVAERYEFTHGTDSVCAYDIRTMDFVEEISAGRKPDCHSTSPNNRYLYMACADGLYCIEQDSLTVVKVLDTGYVYATNVLPDGNTMLVHDAYGGFFVIKDLEDMERIHIHKRVAVLQTDILMDTLGGKGHFTADGRYYMCAAWEHSSIFLIDLERDYAPERFMGPHPALMRGDDLVISRDKTRAYVACHHKQSHLAIIDIAGRQVVKTIPTGNGTCGLTMTNDERYVIASNDEDDSISIIDTLRDEHFATLSARPGCEELGIAGYIQGISVGPEDEIYVYGCSGNGALVKFTEITSGGRWTISHPGGKSSGPCVST